MVVPPWAQAISPYAGEFELDARQFGVDGQDAFEGHHGGLVVLEFERGTTEVEVDPDVVGLVEEDLEEGLVGGGEITPVELALGGGEGPFEGRRVGGLPRRHRARGHPDENRGHEAGTQHLHKTNPISVSTPVRRSISP